MRKNKRPPSPSPSLAGGETISAFAPRRESAVKETNGGALFDLYFTLRKR